MSSHSQDTEMITPCALANGGFPNLGWARITNLYNLKLQEIRLHEDSIFVGIRQEPGFGQSLILSPLNCPVRLLQFISSKYFIIERETVDNGINLKPAVLTVLGRNGLIINNDLMPQNEKRIIRANDVISVRTGPNSADKFALLQFLDDRVYDTEFMPGHITSNFHLDSYIGKGVRLIHRICTGGKYAMKIIPKIRFEAESDHRYKKRLQHMRGEVAAMKNLSNHPNIIRFFDSCESARYKYIIMDYAEMGDLVKYLSRFNGNFLREPEAKCCAYQISKGLDYMHEMNIAHRDLKIDNIFIKSQMVAPSRKEIIYMIGDFGYSKEADKHLMTQIGTPCYLPPEIQENSNETEYTIKADIWTLGCIFYAVLSGQFPFHDSYGYSVREQIANAYLNFNHSIWDRVTDCAKGLIRSMIQVDPNIRPHVRGIIECAEWFQDFELHQRLAFLYPQTLNKISLEPFIKKQRLN